MKKFFKSFLKYVVFSSFIPLASFALPIGTPGLSTLSGGTNSALLFSPTIFGSTSGTTNDCFSLLSNPITISQTNPGSYMTTLDVSSIANCPGASVVITASGGQGGFGGGPGGITTITIPLSTLVNMYGNTLNFYFLVGGAGASYGTDGGGGGESLVSIGNWPDAGGTPLAVGGGGGGGGYGGYPGGGGGGGNDGGQAGDGYGGWGDANTGGSNGNGGWTFDNGPGGSGWFGAGATPSSQYGGWGGSGYGGGGAGGYWTDANGNVIAGDGGAGGGGYCNTSIGYCTASDYTNGGGNSGSGYVKIIIQDNIISPYPVY